MTASAPWTAFPSSFKREHESEEDPGVSGHEQVDVWIGLDVGKEEHNAEVLDNDGERIFARSVVNDQTALERLLDRAGERGTPGLVIDQPGSIAQVALAVAHGQAGARRLRAGTGDAP